MSLIVSADLHIGSTMAPWPDNFILDDGGEYKPSKFQKWLNRCWADQVDSIVDEPILVLNGDLIQGGNIKDGQVITPLVSTQCKASEELLTTLANKCSKVYVIRGTDYHDGKSSADIEQLAKNIGAVRDKATGQYTRWEMYLNYQSHIIHFSHHISASSLPWAQAAAPTRDALILTSELFRRYGSKAPNVSMIVRSHRHSFTSVDISDKLTSVTTPCWQLPTAYSHRKAMNMLPQIGWIEIYEHNTRLLVTPHLYSLPSPSVEEA